MPLPCRPGITFFVFRIFQHRLIGLDKIIVQQPELRLKITKQEHPDHESNENYDVDQFIREFCTL